MEDVENDLAFETYALPRAWMGPAAPGVPTKDDWNRAVLGRAEAVSDGPHARTRGNYQGSRGLSTAAPGKAGVRYDPAVVAVTPPVVYPAKAGTSIAVFGAPFPDAIGDEFFQTPLLSYGTQKAIEVHIFPESMRGTGEGSRPFDLRPNSTMTNATVAQTVAGNDGQTLTIKYKDGEKKVAVSPDTPVVTYVPADKADLKAGATVRCASRASCGVRTARRAHRGASGCGSSAATG